MFLKISKLCSTFFAFFCLASVAGGEDWPQFRGPRRDGSSSETNIATTWDSSTNVTWRVKLPGAGASSPIVVGKKVIVTCYAGYGLDERNPGDQSRLARLVVCYNLDDGKELWRFETKAITPEEDFRGFQALHGYASSTPASDGQNVYVFFGRSGVGALSLDGKAKWAQRVGDKTHNWGSGTSPLLYKNAVIVNASVEGSGLVALDKRTGKLQWSARGIRSAWNSPTLVQLARGEEEVVISSQGEVLAFHPDNGNPLWRCSGVQDYVCPSVIAFQGHAFAIGARAGMGVLVKAGGRGEVSPVWQVGKGSNVSSPVYHDGHLYWASESRGVVYCVNASTGDIVYEERLDQRPDRIYASPVLADGKIYYVSRNNGTFVVAARPQFELVAHNAPLDRSVFNASPAISGGRLLLRSDEYLYAIGQ